MVVSFFFVKLYVKWKYWGGWENVFIFKNLSTMKTYIKHFDVYVINIYEIVIYYFLLHLFLKLTSKEAVVQLFSNTTWTIGETVENEKYLLYWRTEYSNVYMTLVIFILVKVIIIILLIIFSMFLWYFFQMTKSLWFFLVYPYSIVYCTTDPCRCFFPCLCYW